MLCNGFKVWITSDGEPLPEYSVEVEDDNKIVCYIPSEAGKTFEIHFMDTERTRPDTHSVRSFVDGRSAGGNPCRPGSGGSRWGMRTAIDVRKPFQFANLVLTDDDELLEGCAANESLGTIQVRMNRVRLEDQHGYTRKTGYSEVGPIHERSKKAGSHCVSLGADRKCIPQGHVTVYNLDPDGVFAACFTFRYRSEDLLKAQGIIPKAQAGHGQSNSSGGKKRCHDDSNVGENRPNRKLHRMETFDAPSSRDIKPVVFDNNAQNQQTRRASRTIAVKKESTSSRLTHVSCDVIDLTLDD